MVLTLGSLQSPLTCLTCRPLWESSVYTSGFGSTLFLVLMPLLVSLAVGMGLSYLERGRR
jgi:hypothetical protein